MQIYDFDVINENGSTYSLEKYRGQPMIIVNTATKCGLAPQFKQLEALYQKYAEKGLVILGFPSDQFKQEVDSTKGAVEACRTTWGVSFPMHEITKVNGELAAPIFQYLKHEAPGKLGESIKWNFTKFLINRDGQIIKRFAPRTTPDKMIPDIEEML